MSCRYQDSLTSKVQQVRSLALFNLSDTLLAVELLPLLLREHGTVVISELASMDDAAMVCMHVRAPFRNLETDLVMFVPSQHPYQVAKLVDLFKSPVVAGDRFEYLIFRQRDTIPSFSPWPPRASTQKSCFPYRYQPRLV